MAQDASLERLSEILAPLGRLAVAFSGGCDSTLLIAVAAGHLGAGEVLALTVRSPLHPGREAEAAERLARAVGVAWVPVDVDALSDPEIVANPHNRCYLCKRRILAVLREEARSRGFATLADGTNADDLRSHRPGARALAELAVRSPLAEAGLGKQEIRRLSKEMGLPTWDKPSMPCLATRIPYNTPLSRSILAQVERSEDFIRNLGFKVVRVRHYGELARIEVEEDEIKRLLAPQMRRQIVQGLKDAGYAYVTVDLRGYRSGSLDEVS